VALGGDGCAKRTPQQAAYIGVAEQGPFKADTYRY